jgi:RNA polymerase sigma factor (sigma-70 family)
MRGRAAIMANAPARLVLRHVRNILAAHEAEQLSDRELLRRFADGREEAAFAALVRRHGPMVLGVCQRVLHDTADAEDAFQATFLILARKAKSGGWCESVGPWLYRVAHGMALRVRIAGQRRRQHESRAAARSAEDPLAAITGRELAECLDAELQRLPERLRAPLVLCCLEGQTRDEAARQLGWSLATLKRRLEQGRERLRQRLHRRGFELPTVVGGALVASGVAVPAALARATLKAAMLTPSTAGCFALTKFAIASLLLIGFATAGYQLSAERSPLTPAVSGPADKPEPVGPQSEMMTLNPERVSLTGNVVDAQGKPVSGATVLLSEGPVSWSSSEIPGFDKWQPTKTRTLARTATDAEGRFVFKDVAVGLPDQHRPTSFPLDIVVSARGRSLAWKHWLLPGEPQPMRLALPKESALRGHVTDLDGRPVKSARVEVVQIARLDQVEPADTTHEACVYLHHAPIRLVAETDADGVFAIAGVPEGVRATLRVSHDRFVLREIFAATMQQQPLPAVLIDPRSSVYPDRTPQPVLSGEIVIPLKSAGRLLGRVLYADTGKPVPNAGVGLTRWPPDYAAGADGRFTIGGLPPARHDVRIYPPKGADYLGWADVIEVDAGKDLVKDFTVNRGVPATGRVLDEETGKAVAGVGIIFFSEKAPVSAERLLTQEAETGPDGRFRITLPPVKGELFICRVPQDYTEPDVAVGHSITEAGPRFRRKVDATAGKEAPDVTFQLTQGFRILGRVLDPDGKPAADVVVETRQYETPNSFRDLSLNTDKNGVFQFGGLNGQECELIVRDPRRKLSARIMARPAQGKPKQLDVKLQRMIRVTGCVRDEDGKPVAAAYIRPWTYDGKMGRATPYVAQTDAQGLFAMDMLVAGANYDLQVGAKGYCGVYSREFVLKPGDPHTLADLTLRKAKESLAGVLVSKTGKPLAGVIVRASAKGFEGEARVTDALGRFQFSGVPRGTIQVDAWLPWIKGGSLTQAAEAGNQNARIELPVEDKPD